MASAITAEADERTALSTFRSMGATFANLVIGVVTPLLIYTKDAQGNQIIRGGNTFTIIAGVFSVLAIVCYVICYKLTTERVKIEKPANTKPVNPLETFKAVFKSRALLGIIGAAIFLLLSQLMISTINNYLYPEYFNNATGISVYTVIITVVMLFIVAPTSVKLSKRFGKVEVATAGMMLSSATYFIMFFLRTENMWIFLILSAIGYLGLAFFNSVIWANITDVIDQQELVTNRREDGTVYAVYSFARKIGQALAGGAGGWALAIIGYNSAEKIQTPEVIEGIYSTATLVPAIGFLCVGLVLWFIYPLKKKVVEENVAKLKAKREAK